MNIVRKEETYKETYTIDDIYALPDGERAELIDSQIYYLAIILILKVEIVK